MSVNTDNEYTSYLSNVHEVTETLGPVTFNVREVMNLMIMISPWTIYARKTSRFLQRKENLLRSTCSRPILLVKRCQTVVVVPYIVLISMGRGVISTHLLFILRSLEDQGSFDRCGEW
jgi:hypothetical protein